jgi:hypothetical protein
MTTLSIGWFGMVFIHYPLDILGGDAVRLWPAALRSWAALRSQAWVSAIKTGSADIKQNSFQSMIAGKEAGKRKQRPLLGFILARSHFQMDAFMSLQVFNNLKQVIGARVSLWAKHAH